MASNPNGFITVDSCITDYLSQSEQSISKYFKIWNLAFRAMDLLGLDFFYQIKSVKLPILANKTVVLPSDYLQYSKIGVLNAKGEVIPLNYNNKLTTYADLLPDRQSKTIDNTLLGLFSPNSDIFYNYWQGGIATNLYGIPSNTPVVGSFKIDIHNGIVLLGEDFRYDYLIIEYLAAPTEGQDYYIPIQFREAMIAFLEWKDSKYLGKWGFRLEASKRHDFYNERKNAIARYKPIVLHEAYQASLENTRMTVKN